MGRSKQLLPINNKPALLHSLERIIAAGVEDIITVVRHDREDLITLLCGLPVRIVLNRNAESEMAESVRIGLHEIGNAVTGIVVCLSDHPLVSTDTYRLLLHAHEQEPGKILIPCAKGKNGHPVLFPKEVIRAVFEGMNLRDVIRANTQRVIHLQVLDEGVLYDMDTMEEYHDILKKYQNGLFA